MIIKSTSTGQKDGGNICVKLNLIFRFLILLENSFYLSEQKVNDYMEAKWLRSGATTTMEF